MRETRGQQESGSADGSSGGNSDFGFNGELSILKKSEK
jgi:hypothetical protein